MKKKSAALMREAQKLIAISAKRRARMAARSEESKVNAADGLDGAPGGGEDLAKANDAKSLGEEDFGISIPPELESVIEDGVAEDSKDESYQPGVLVPPGLEDAVMAVADVTGLEEEGMEWDMIPFAPVNATTAAEVLHAGAHWMLCANGEPVAKITLSEQDNAERIAAHFASEDYARSVIEGIAAHGLKATLEATRAKPYVAKVDENAKVAATKARLETENAAQIRNAISEVKAKYVDTLGLVLDASAANFIVEDSLKDGLVAFMTSAGVPEAIASEGVDNAYFQHGPKSIAAKLDKAEEWANLSEEALKEIRAAVEQAGPRARPLPSTFSPAQANPDYDQNLANKFAASAVPVQQAAPMERPVSATATNPSRADDGQKSDFRAKFGSFRSH